MIQFSNIWKHPKTSLSGVLISVATVAGVLAQQGIGLGSLGGGTVVSLAGALATALLGMLARDPGSTATPAVSAANCPENCTQCAKKPGVNGKLGAWLLIMLLIPLPWLQGCTSTTVAQDIVNWTPSLQSAVATVDSTAALLDPADAPVFATATAGFGAASNLLITQARNYLENPTAGTLAQLQAQIVVLQQQVNGALLMAARIVNPASQQHAMAAIQAVATIVNAILSLVQLVSSKAPVVQMAADSSIKLSAVAPYLDHAGAARMIAAHYGEPLPKAQAQVAQSEQAEAQAGF